MTHDEIDLIRAIRPEEVSYDPLNKARARARMLDGNAHPPRRRRRRTTAFALTAAATAATAAVAAAVVGVGDGTPGRQGSGPAAAPPDARQMVLAAAHQAERRATGRYLTVHDRSCFSLPVRHEVGTYFIAVCDELWQWQARDRTHDRARNSAIWSRDLPRRPLTPRDEALWKKAGSPRTFPYQELPKKFPDYYKIGGTPWKEDAGKRDSNSGKFFVPGPGKEFSARQIQELPTDPEALRKIFLPDLGKRTIATGPGEDIDRLSGAVSDLPLPPKVWAGLIRMLTGTPGVRAVGRVTDPIGRPGVALEAPRSTSARGGRGPVTTMERIIFAPGTGELLASVSTTVKPGADMPKVMNSRVRISATWSDTKPGSPPR
ncbi:CU044_5270 family protein [Actinomadura kijaniata]|uniref:CU044_5270 family protein n=1 Tax=Actinomadura kijaniata TaxID=46161 RepID=UPI00082FDF5B|nr:CU044_5270 family protein [Actinomadura kijaniata]